MQQLHYTEFAGSIYLIFLWLDKCRKLYTSPKGQMSGTNEDVTTIISSKRPRKPPTVRKDDFFLDGHQQNP
jgi:hypothetical protein